MIIAPPEKELNFPSAEIEFEVKQEDLQKVIRAGSVLQLPEISIIGKDGKISIAATNAKDVTSDQYSVDVTTTDLTFNMIYKADNIIKLISSNYNVKISSKLISKFTSASGVNVYYIAAEKDSKFGE